MGEGVSTSQKPHKRNGYAGKGRALHLLQQGEEMKTEWRVLIAVILLAVAFMIGALLGCQRVLPVQVTIDDGTRMDTLKVSQLLGVWKHKQGGRTTYWQQIDFRPQGYVFMVWDSTASPITAKNYIYAEIGNWELISPNNVYLTVTNSTSHSAVDTDDYILVKIAGDYLWLGSSLYSRGSWIKK